MRIKHSPSLQEDQKGRHFQKFPKIEVNKKVICYKFWITNLFVAKNRDSLLKYQDYFAASLIKLLGVK